MKTSSKVFAILGIIFGALGFICSEAKFVQYVIEDDAWWIFYGFLTLTALACIILNMFEIISIKRQEDKEELLKLIAGDKNNEN